MTSGSWIGPLGLANELLNGLGADRKGERFEIAGTEIEKFLDVHSDDPGWEIIEVKPDTLVFVNGIPTRLAELLLNTYSSIPPAIAGLPVLTKQ